ncbi:gamma-glutamyl-gamma-aminobutyrate hydrolase family protein [Sphingomonas sp. GlSt437]|uniref:gamma-glutamyl-gamma-aminobutyrate hydrolase family protein n=1 Tax=Sphingomonas sp. GlSt437 TaxID=3389970 RepID=UPI003A8BB76D
MRPVVGLLCCNEHHRRDVQVVATRFIQPLADIAGASALLVPAVTDACDVRAVAARLDGLLLTGSQSNVAAHRYGGAFDLAPCDEARDDVALRLAAAMIETGKPVFGICRGFQELNVLFGGTLTSDLPTGVHHSGEAEEDPGDAAAFERLFDHAHAIALQPKGLLHAALGGDRARVNSVHRQGVDRLGSDLIVEAIADDGLIEAFSAKPFGSDVLAVQWHPEWSRAPSGVNRLFFDRLGQALYHQISA